MAAAKAADAGQGMLREVEFKARPLGIQIQVKGDKLKVRAISAEYLIGKVTVGSEIVAIGGKPVKTMKLAQMKAELQKNSTPFKITFRMEAKTVHQEYKDRLSDILKQKNPAAVAKVELLLRKFEGNEHDIYVQVCKKYKLDVKPRYTVPKPQSKAKAQPTAKKKGDAVTRDADTANSAEALKDLYDIWRAPTAGEMTQNAKSEMENCTKIGALWILHRTPKLTDFYDVGNIVGQPGAFGVVKTSHKKDTGEIYATKIIKKFKYKNRKQTRNYFMDIRREVRLLEMAKGHPNVIQLEEVFEDVQYVYLVMEHCSGGELYDRLAEERSFSEKDASAILRQMFHAIYYLHCKNIVHCDVKPENFIFKSKHKNSPIKLIDFGMAKIVRWREYCSLMNGTPFYIAPEVLDKHYGTACDIWSLGVVMFVMIFGFAPFYDPDNNVVYKKIRKGFRAKVKGKYGPWFPETQPVTPACYDIIGRLLTTKVADRLTAEESLEHSWLTGEMSATTQLHPISDAAVVQSLRHFHRTCHLQEDILEFLSECDYLRSDESKHLHLIFDEMDVNHDGHLTYAELHDALKKMDPDITEHDCETIMKSLDSQKHGYIEYHDILTTRINRKLCSKEQRLEKLFNELDQNGDGSLSLEELTEAMSHVHNKKYSQAEIKKHMDAVDSNHDGVIQYEEFLEMWNEKKTFDTAE